MKNVVVEGCQFIITVGGTVIGTGNVNISSLPSTNTKVILGEVKKGVYAGPMSISVAGYTDAAISSGTGAGVITPSSQHNTVDTLPVVLEGDSGEVVLSGVNPQSGGPVTGYTVTIKIQSAGQSYYKAD
ncbi:MAG: hypothetical protein J6W16_07285 [Methanobrevibacter sp.]|nr:hypothetical protein [Methanobrevibacter sp.]MBP5785367.1 hypothetical protein [Methanobrevibacter sp.]